MFPEMEGYDYKYEMETSTAELNAYPVSSGIIWIMNESHDIRLVDQIIMYGVMDYASGPS